MATLIGLSAILLGMLAEGSPSPTPTIQLPKGRVVPWLKGTLRAWNRGRMGGLLAFLALTGGLGAAGVQMG